MLTLLMDSPILHNTYGPIFMVAERDFTPRSADMFTSWLIHTKNNIHGAYITNTYICSFVPIIHPSLIALSLFFCLFSISRFYLPIFSRSPRLGLGLSRKKWSCTPCKNGIIKTIIPPNHSCLSRLD